MLLRKLFFPRRCPCCSRPMTDGIICPECRERLDSRFALREYVTDCGHIERAVYLFDYAMPEVKNLLFKAKRIGSAEAVGVISGYLARAIKELGLEGPLSVTFVPRRPEAKKLYAADQSELIAKATASLCGAGFHARLSVKKRSLPQHSLKSAERRKNVQGIFSPSGEPGPNEILIDDIITTGATVTEAAKTLCGKKEKLTVLVFAH